MASGIGDTQDMRHDARDSVLWPGRVTQVVDPQYFWMQMGSSESLFQFDTLQRDLQKFGTSYGWHCVEDSQQLEPEQRVIVDTGDGTSGEVSRFKRGVITRLAGEDCVDVFYVDFGTNEMTTTDKICIDFPAAFTAWPIQAFRCSLAGVQPISKNWTSRGTKTFQKATSGPVVHVLLLCIQPGYYEVALYPSVDDKARSVAHHLLDEDVAMPMDGSNVPEFVKDIPAFVSAMRSEGYFETSQTNGDSQMNQSTSGSQDSSPQSGKPQYERYIPPGLKHRDRSPPRKISCTVDTSPRANYSTTSQRANHSDYAGAPVAESPSRYNAGKSSQKGLKLKTDLQNKAPVVDFFPFENVSTYPPSPVSPQKAAARSLTSPGTGHQGELSSEARYDHVSPGSDYPRQHQDGSRDSRPYDKSYNSHGYSKYQSDENYTEYSSSYYSPESQSNSRYNRGSGRGLAEGSPSQDGESRGYSSPSKSGSSYSRSGYEHSRGDGNNARKPLHRESKFAANFDNLPSESVKFETRDNGKSFDYGNKSSTAGLNSNQESVINSFEPSYLQSSLEKQGVYQGSTQSSRNTEPGQHRTTYTKSPEKFDTVRSNSSPAKSHIVRDYALGTGHTPFYPPKSAMDDVNSQNSRQVILTPPSFYETSLQANNNNNNSKTHEMKSDGSGYYQNDNSYDGSGVYQHPVSRYASSPSRSATYDAKQFMGRPPYQYSNYSSSGADNSTGKSSSKTVVSGSQSSKQRSGDNDYDSGGAYDVNYEDRSMGYGATYRPPQNSKQSNDTNYNAANSSPTKLNVNIQRAQGWAQSTGYGYERQKSSPESPAIAAFNLGDLEHTQEISTDRLKQQIHAERLQVLQEEAGDIEAEMQEHAALTEMSRFGGRPDDVADYSSLVDSADVFHEISKEIDHTIRQPQKEYEDMKKPPGKPTRSAPDTSEQVRLDSISSSYLSNIDFANAVKEALDFSLSGDVDMGNLKKLLNDVMESVGRAHAESQLCDVLIQLLSRAIQDYDRYHGVVMEAIDTLNAQVDMKDSLVKALKRQQELYVRLPQSSKVSMNHKDFAYILGHVYSHSIFWTESNAAIQDSIPVTVEKWVLFNNRGTQIGQKDKENLFLDCFCAFWETGGDLLKQHNESFCGRVEAEIKKKLLNEDVSRDIRERLLDILLGLFSVSKPAPQLVDAYTQTLKRTMIPSSCQVKPEMFSCDKGVMTDSDWMEMLVYEFAEDGNFIPESQSPKVSLRPGGKMASAYDSQPEYNSPAQTERSNESAACSFTSRDNISYTSGNISIGNESMYTTANESLISEYATIDQAKGGHSQTEKSRSVDQEPVNHSHKGGVRTAGDRKISGSSYKSTFEDSDSWNKERERSSHEPSVPKSPSKSNSVSVTQAKSVQRSIVDWFDYEPEPDVDTETASAVKEDKAVPSNDSISNTSVVKTVKNTSPKAAISDTTAMAVSSVASGKKSKKNKKSSQLNTKKNDFKGQHVELNCETSVRVNDVRDDVEVIESKEENVAEEEVDWWGKEEDPKPTQMYGQAPGSLGLFIDSGPDVIIESECEHEFADIANSDNVENVDIDISKVTLSDTESTRGGHNLREEAHTQDEPLHSVTVENTAPSESRNMQSTEEEMILCVDEGLKKIDDEYAFDTDDDDDGDFYNFGSDAEDFDISKEPSGSVKQPNSTYDEDFPQSDLMVPICRTPEISVGANCESAAVDAAVGEGGEYDRSFPQTNLGDFIRTTEVEYREPTTMWVPSKRRCLKCYDEGHRTENCPNGSLLLQ